MSINLKIDEALGRIGQNLKRAREAKGLNPTDVARRIGRKSSSAGNKISQIENGEVTGLTIGLVVKLGQAVGATLEQLVGDPEGAWAP